MTGHSNSNVIKRSTAIVTFLLFIGYIMSISSAASSGSTQNADDIETLKAALEARIKDGRSVGYGVALIGYGDPISFGVGTTIKGSDTKITNDSLFEIGSITKTFTGILLADMARFQKRVKLDDPIKLYLPDGVKAPSRGGRDITFLDLATHHSGLPRMPNNFFPADPLNPFADYSAQQLYDFLNTHELTRDIGETPEYSNLGYGLLAHILSLKTGKSYETLLKENIFDPMRMKSSYITVPDNEKTRLTTGHNINLDPVPHWDFDVFAGAGAIKSTPKDMLLYLEHALDHRFLSHPDHNKIRMSMNFERGFGAPTMKIGLGWLTDIQRPNSSPRDWITWHNGGTYGYRSYLGFNRKQERGVFIVANAQDDVDAIGRAVLAGDIDTIFPKDEQKIIFNEKEIKDRTGTYPLAPGFDIVITQNDNQFFLQATNQPRFPIFPISKDKFFLKVVEATISFGTNKDGKTTLTLHQSGQTITGVRSEDNGE